MLAVLVQRRRSDATQRTAGQFRFEQVRRVGGTFGFARPDHQVQFIDKQNDRTVGILDFAEHRFESFFEIAAEFCPGNQRPHIQRNDAFLFERLRHVAFKNPQRQTFGDRGFADAGLPDQHRVVLSSSRQHLDHAADLVVPADHRVQFSLGRQTR